MPSFLPDKEALFADAGRKRTDRFAECLRIGLAKGKVSSPPGDNPLDRTADHRRKRSLSAGRPEDPGNAFVVTARHHHHEVVAFIALYH